MTASICKHGVLEPIQFIQEEESKLFNERLVDLPVNEWQEEERQDFAIALRDIRQTTGNLLATIDPGSVKAGEGKYYPSLLFFAV